MDRRRTIILVTLIIAALAGGAALVFSGGSHRRGPRGSEEDANAPVSYAGSEEHPALEFPKEARCDDEEANRFIENFYRVCCSKDFDTAYDKFRLMMTTRVDPFTPERFKRALAAVKRLRIEAIEKLPEVADVPPPVYVVRSRVYLRPGVKTDSSERTITILVFKELGNWVMAPAPKSLRDGLDAFLEEERAADANAPTTAEAPGGNEPAQ
ncbi:MAG: hypothetical protein JXQ73_04945 [Phycisphaerae bacterium]|nr:hypothetical protein [Phycisphaerae bacterium]